MTTAFDPLKITDDDLRKLEREELEAVSDKALRQAAELDRALGEWFFTPEELEQPEEMAPQDGEPAPAVFFANFDYSEEKWKNDIAKARKCPEAQQRQAEIGRLLALRGTAIVMLVRLADEEYDLIEKSRRD